MKNYTVDMRKIKIAVVLCGLATITACEAYQSMGFTKGQLSTIQVACAAANGIIDDTETYNGIPIGISCHVTGSMGSRFTIAQISLFQRTCLDAGGVNYDLATSNYLPYRTTCRAIPQTKEETK